MGRKRNTKIDEHIFAIVHKMYANGKKPKEIAAALSIGYSTTNSMLRCKTQEEFDKYRDRMCEKQRAYSQKKKGIKPKPITTLDAEPVQLKLDPYVPQTPTYEQIERLITALDRITDLLNDEKKIKIYEEAN